MTRSSAATIAIAVVLGIASSAQAADYFTTTLADGADVLPGDGICATAEGECTARAALAEAGETARAGDPSTVHLLPGVHPLELGTLTVPPFVNLVGAGRDSTVLLAGVSAWWGEIRNLEVRDASINLGDGVVRGCRVVGGSIASQGVSLEVRDTEVRDSPWWAVSGSQVIVTGSSLARNEGGVLLRGGSVRDSVVSENRGTGVLVDADGFSPGAVEIERTVIADNAGAGVRHEGSQLTLIDSVIVGNAAEVAGEEGFTAGGVLMPLIGCTEAGSLTLVRCQVRDNEVRDVRVTGSVTLTACHVGSLAAGVNASCGMHVPCASVSLSNSTVESAYACSLTAEHATIGALSGTQPWNGGFVRLDQTVLLECGGSGRSGDFNFTPTGCSVAGEGNLQGDDPLLGPLQDDGTGRWSRRPLPGSPLIDAGDPGDETTQDQAGRRRPIDFDGDGLAISDIGAIEACPDSDGDGLCDEDDCAPSDPGASSPPEVVDLVASTGATPDEVLLTWTAPPGALEHELARGSLNRAWASGSLATECAGSTVGADFLDDAGPGSWFYLVRARHACLGSWGRDSTGRERDDCR